MVALPNIYNTGILYGEDFVSEAFSKVSYHCKNPAMNDEFKIRLPDLLTWRHQLKFTVMHIHVKAKEPGRSSLLPSFVSSKRESVKDVIYTEIGLIVAR